MAFPQAAFRWKKEFFASLQLFQFFEHPVDTSTAASLFAYTCHGRNSILPVKARVAE